MRRFALAVVLLVATSAAAWANGRPAGTSTINFRHGNESDILAGMTFGALLSHDGGATWHWTCEDAIGYSGTWDPDYEFLPNGHMLGTTYAGLVDTTDLCTFGKTAALGNKFASQAELGPDDKYYVAMVDPADSKIYRSDDQAATFPTSATPGAIGDWWESLRVAKSDPKRLYATGYRFVPDPGGAGNIRVNTSFRSDDAGASWIPLPVTAFTVSMDSVLEIAAISPTDPDLVFMRVTFENATVGDAIYRSIDKGQTWTRVYSQPESLHAFIMRDNGDVVAGTIIPSVAVAKDCARTGPCTAWTQLPTPPHTSCFTENSAGELWACTVNFGRRSVLPDGYAIMKTTDYTAWTGVLRLQDIAGPLDCGATSPTATLCTRCEALVTDAGTQTPKSCWCMLRDQFGITANPTNCPPPPVDGTTETGILMIKKPKGCCDTGEGNGVAPGAVMLSLVSGIVLFRRRKR